MFQHGLCGTANQPAEVFPNDTDWSCVTLECRGHGESECGDYASLSIEQFTKDLAAFIASLDAGPVLVGGISMGSAIALRLAVTSPVLVNGLVLARPAWISHSAPENLAPSRDVARLLAKYEPTEAKLRFEESPSAARLSQDAPDNLKSLLGFFDRTPIAETQALLATISADGPGVSLEQISRLSVPTLVIGTAQDAIHPLAMATEIKDLIPNARLVEITPKSSNLQLYRAEFQTALRQFIQEME